MDHRVRWIDGRDKNLWLALSRRSGLINRQNLSLTESAVKDLGLVNNPLRELPESIAADPEGASGGDYIADDIRLCILNPIDVEPKLRPVVRHGNMIPSIE